jgi:hypothetical protein
MCCRRHLPIEMKSSSAQFFFSLHCVRSPGRTFLRFELPFWCLVIFALWRSAGLESLWRSFFLSFRHRGSFLSVRRCCGFSLWRSALFPLRRPATAATPERLQRRGPPVCQVLLRGLLLRQKKRASSFVGTSRSTSSSSTSSRSHACRVSLYVQRDDSCLTLNDQKLGGRERIMQQFMVRTEAELNQPRN